MKDFKRENTAFSLCGLNCSLCPMNLNQYCPGCGGGAGNQFCAIARCSLQHGQVEYCFQCENYPCEKYDGIDRFDSFITHQRQKLDMQKCAERGAGAYTAEQRQKRAVLDRLLAGYNDGRKKTLFCVAVNLLELADLEAVLRELDANAAALAPKERAAYAARLLEGVAVRTGVVLKLRKKK